MSKTQLTESAVKRVAKTIKDKIVLNPTYPFIPMDDYVKNLYIKRIHKLKERYPEFTELAEKMEEALR